VKQILINLISNAVKYTKPGGEIEVRLLVNKRKREWQLSVRDSGVGIEADRIAHLFTAFIKIQRHRELNTEGVGLGLTISKTLALAMGGDLSVESVVSKGSLFTLTLPYQPLQNILERSFEERKEVQGSSSNANLSDSAIMEHAFFIPL
jgi:signal transduction histidine kinase